MMTQDQAFEQIMSLRNQKVSYRDIAKHLESVGYKSPLTKRPIGEQAIRNIVDRLNGVQRQEKRAKEREDKIYVTQRQTDLKQGIEEIMSLRSFTDQLKLEMIKSLVKIA